MKFYFSDFTHLWLYPPLQTLATPGPHRLQRHIADKLGGEKHGKEMNKGAERVYGTMWPLLISTRLFLHPQQMNLRPVQGYTCIMISSARVCVCLSVCEWVTEWIIHQLLRGTDWAGITRRLTGGAVSHMLWHATPRPASVHVSVSMFSSVSPRPLLWILLFLLVF